MIFRRQAERSRELRVLALVAAFAAAGFGSSQRAVAQEGKAAQLPDFVQLAAKLGPVVVNISATQAVRRSQSDAPPRGPSPFGGEDPLNDFWRRFFGDRFGTPPGPQQALGSGFIVDKQGLILTNNHVVENAQKIIVTLVDDRKFEATVVGRDPKTDIAVVRITNSKGDLPVASLGNSDNLEVGEWVMAMGSPFGLDNTVTAGIVSAKGRNIGAGPYDNFIQTDASINPGNSGGPLFNLSGEVVGISTAIFSRSGGNIGIGFAIPINVAKEILPELIKKGKVTRGWLGVTVQRVTPQIARAFGLENERGALVASVAPGSPAEQAGIKTGDVIVDFNGQPIKESQELAMVVGRTDVGENAKITVLRENQRIPISVKIGELKEQELVASASVPGNLGLTVQEVTPEMAPSLGLERAQGVVITAVEPQSPGGDAGLQRGDVILEVDRKRIHNVADLRNALSQAKPGSNLLVLISRRGSNVFLALEKPGAKG